MLYDYIIKNGLLFNPVSQNLISETIAIKNGKIKRNISSSDSATFTINANNAIISPGWIDFHTHLYSKGSGFGLNADLAFSTGVTCMVDMGSAGSSNLEAMLFTDFFSRSMDCFAYLNISPIGQAGKGLNEIFIDDQVQINKISNLIHQYKHIIRGLKVRISKGIVKEKGLQPLKQALTYADYLGLPICVHVTDAPSPQPEVLSMLRPGDVFSHVFHGKGYTILNAQGELYPEVLKAQQNGILFDVGNGRFNFDFTIAAKAISAGFLPNIISSDTTVRTYNTDIMMRNLPYVMSKFLALGMSLEQVITAVTLSPAQVLNLNDDYGTLADGDIANITIFCIQSGNFKFKDANENILAGTQLLIPQLTMSHGQIMYINPLFNL